MLLCVFVSLEKRSENDATRCQKMSLFGGGQHGSSVVNSGPNLCSRVLEQAPFLYHMLGSMLESFWEPSLPLYSFLVARMTKTGSQKRG